MDTYFPTVDEAIAEARKKGESELNRRIIADGGIPNFTGTQSADQTQPTGSYPPVDAQPVSGIPGGYATTPPAQEKDLQYAGNQGDGIYVPPKPTEQAAAPPPPEEQQSYIKRVGWGLASWAGDRASGLTDLFGDALDSVEGDWTSLKDTYLDDVVNGKMVFGKMADNGVVGFKSAAEMRDARAKTPELIKGVGMAVHDLADTFDAIGSESYKPMYSDFNKALEDASNGSFGYLLGWMAEQSPQVAADVALAMTAPVTAGLALTGGYAKDRAANDGRDKPNAEDYAYAATAAVLSLTLDRITGKGMEAIFGKEGMQALANIGGHSLAARTIKGATRGFLAEGASGAQEEIMLSANTKKGVVPRDVMLNALAEGIMGAPVGGGVDALVGSSHAPANIEPKVKGGGTNQNGPAEDIAAAADAAGPTPGPRAEMPEEPAAVPQQTNADGVSVPPEAAADPSMQTPVTGEGGPAEAVSGVAAPEAAIPTEVAPGVTANVDATGAPANVDAPVDPNAQVNPAIPPEPGVFTDASNIDVPATEADRQRALSEAPNPELEAAKAERDAASLNKETAAMQLAAAVTNPDAKLNLEPDATGKRADPRKAMTDMFDSLSNLARAEVPTIESKLKDRAAKKGIAYVDRNEQARLQDALSRIAARFGRARTTVQDIAASAGSTRQRRALAGLLTAAEKDMKNLGIDPGPMIKAAKGRDPVALYRAMQQVTQQAQERTAGRDVGGLPEPAKDKPYTGSMDEAWGRARVPTASASDQLYDAQGKRRRDISPDEMAQIEQDIEAEQRAKEKAKYGTEVYDYNVDSDVQTDTEMEQAANRKLSGERSARKGATPREQIQLRAKESKKGRDREESQARRREGRDAAPKFSEQVWAQAEQKAFEAQMFGESRSVDEARQLMEAKLESLDPEGVIQFLRRVERSIKAAKIKEAGKAKGEKKASKANARATGLPFVAKANAKARAEASDFITKNINARSGERKELGDALRVARRMAENAMEMRGELDYYRGEWVLVPGKTRKQDKLTFIQGVRPKLMKTGDWSNPQREQPQTRPEQWKHAFYTADQLEVGPAHPIHVTKDELTGKTRGEQVPLNKTRMFVSPAHYDDILRYVAWNTDYADPLALTDALLVKAMGSSKSASGTAGYQGVKGGPKHGDVLTADKGTTTGPDSLTADQIVEMMQDDTGDGMATFVSPTASDISVDDLVQLIRDSGLAVSPEQEETMGRINGDIKRVQELERSLDEVDADEIRAAVEAMDPEPANDAQKFLQDTADVTKRMSTPLGTIFATKTTDGKFFDVVDSDVLKDRPEAGADEALTEAFMEALDKKVAATEREIANLKKDIANAQKSLGSLGGAARNAARKARDAQSPWGEGAGRGDVTETTAAEPLHLGGVKRKRAPERQIADLYKGIARSEPLDPGVDLSEFEPGVERAGLMQLRDYQVEGVASILHTWQARKRIIAAKGKGNLARSGFALFDKPGSGKSLQIAIAAAKIAEAEAQGEGRQVLIVVPNQSLRNLGGVMDTDYARNIIADGKRAGVDLTTDQFKFIQYGELAVSPAAAKAKFKDEYAAVFFDEAHSIKNLGGRNLGPNAAALNTDYRVFVTATPTDMAGQEVYYLAYMLSETNPATSSLNEARRFVMDQLRLSEDGRKVKTSFSEAAYINALTEQFLDPAIARHQSVSRAMPAISENAVETIPENLLDREAVGSYTKAANDAQKEQLLEHMKVPALVESTVSSLKSGSGEQVIVVFKSNMEDSKAKNLGKFTESPLVRFHRELAVRMQAEGLTNEKIAIYAGPDKINSKAIRDFQVGDARVLVMTDTAGATGINLDDNPSGSRDKYFDHLPKDGRPEVESRPRKMLIAGVSLMGERLTQLLGRVDRANTQTIPTVTYLAVDGNPTEARNRANLRRKVELQDAVTGITRARAAGVLEDTNPSLMQAEKDGNKIFREDGTAPRLDPNNQTVVDMDLRDHIGEGTDAHSALDFVQEQAVDPATKLFAKIVKSIPSVANLKVRMIPREVANDANEMGYYDPSFDPETIYLHPDASDMVDTMLHETVHYLTAYDVLNDPNVAAKLQRIMDGVPFDVKAQFEYAFTNPAEFVAEAFSNELLRAKLINTKARGERTFWQRFKDFVWGIFRSHGATSGRSVFDQIVDMNLLMSDNAGTQFKPSESRAAMGQNGLFKRRPEFEPVAPGPARRSLLGKLEDYIDGIGGRGTSESAAGVAEKAMLATMTVEQIADTYGKMSTVSVRGEGEKNLLKNILHVFERRFAKTQKLSADYTEKVMDPVRKYATTTGQRMIKVRMAKGQEPIRMTEFEYLSNMMTLSGIAQAHFGKDINAKENSVIASQMRRDIAGNLKNTQGEQAIIWQLHKEQFNRISPEARDLYNHLADYFSQQYDRKSVLLGAMWLDANFPRKSGESWTTQPAQVVRDKVKAAGKMSDEELSQLSVGRDALKEVQNMLKPGRVPGAYFPLQRFGKYVVVAEAEWDALDDKEAYGFMARHPGARYDAKKGVVTYKEVSRFESLTEAETYVAQMRDQHSDYDVTDPMLADDEMIFQRANISSAMFETFQKKIDKLDTTKENRELLLKQFSQVALEMSPTTNIASTLMPRNRVLGASTDIVRVLANYGAGNSHYMSGIEFSKQMSDAKRELAYFVRQEMAAQPHHKPGLRSRSKDGRRLARVLQELQKRDAMQHDPFEMGKAYQAMSDVGFLYYLTGVSYNVVNMTQVPLFTVPFLSGRHGNVKAAAAVTRAYKAVGGAPIAQLVKTGGTMSKLKPLLAMKGTTQDFDKRNYRILDQVKEGVTDENHLKLLEYMAEMGDIEATLAMDFQRTSERSHVDANGHPRPQTKWEYLTEWMKMAPHIVEVMNRSVTAIAAFDLQYAKDRKAGMDHEAAFASAADYARTAIKRSQFIYAPWNRARIMQGQRMRTLMMFKQYSQNTYYNLIRNFVLSSKGISKKLRGEKMSEADLQDYREASRSLTSFLGLMLLANGVMGGTPEPVKWLTQLVYWAVGDDDEPFDWELKVQQTMADWFGPELGRVFSKGLPTLAGLDMSGRTGINSMLLFDRNSGSGRDSWVANIARTVGGPMFSLGERMLYDAPTLLHDGQVTRAAEAVAPKAIRDVIRTARIEENGFTDYKGKVYASSDELSWGEYAAMYLGFTPDRVTEIYTQRSVLQQDRAMMGKRSDFYDRYFRARTQSEKADIRKEIAAWNQRNPTYRITASQLIKSMAERRRQERATQNAVYVPQKRRAHIDEQMNFVK